MCVKQPHDVIVPGDSLAAGQVDATVRWFWLFVTGHVALWTLVPALTQPNAPLDTFEMLYWGHEWQLGYYKHPPVPAWIAEVACRLLGRTAWPTYLASQVCVAFCFWAAWQLGRELLKPWQALVAATALEASYYYNFTTPELNNNVVSRMFWALAILFLFRAVTRARLVWWGLTGVMLGLGMASKYDTALLVIVMVGFGLLHPRMRSCWRTSGPYLTLLVASLCFLPHVYWLWENDFPTVGYILRRSASAEGLSNHLVNPLKFVFSQSMAALPIAIACLLLLRSRWKIRPNRTSDEEFRGTFLLAFVLGPPLLILMVSLLTGMRIRSMWGAALWTYTGVLVLHFMQARWDLVTCRRAVQACGLTSCAIAAIFAVCNVSFPFVRQKGSRIHYPGQQLSQEVERRWRQAQGGDLEIIAGDWWPAANVAFYGTRRRSVYADLESWKSPWTSDEQLRELGGVIILDYTHDQQRVFRDLKRRFPSMTIAEPIELAWNTSVVLPKLRFGVAVVPAGNAHAQLGPRLGAERSRINR